MATCVRAIAREGKIPKGGDIPRTFGTQEREGGIASLDFKIFLGGAPGPP